MSQELGGGGSIPIGNSKPIEIPQDEAPQNQLQQDQKIQLLTSENGFIESFKVLSRALDNIPGYLDAKISSQFSIVDNKIELIGFGALKTSDLSEGT
ncbi:unnamed protein product, partial [marine sediment metagenome]